MKSSSSFYFLSGLFLIMVSLLYTQQRRIQKLEIAIENNFELIENNICLIAALDGVRPEVCEEK